MKTNNDIITTAVGINALIAKIKKLACGRSREIPRYGRVKAYRDYRGIRRYSLSGSSWASNGGNLGIEDIETDLYSYAFDKTER